MIDFVVIVVSLAVVLALLLLSKSARTLTIGEQIEARIAEARSKRLLDKAQSIAKELGTYRKLGNHISVQEYSDTLLIVEYTFYSSHLEDDGTRSEAWDSVEIRLPRDNRKVFEGRGFGDRIVAYVPGDWEIHLEELSNRARAKIAKKEEKEYRDKLRDFGIE